MCVSNLTLATSHAMYASAALLPSRGCICAAKRNFLRSRPRLVGRRYFRWRSYRVVRRRERGLRRFIVELRLCLSARANDETPARRQSVTDFFVLVRDSLYYDVTDSIVRNHIWQGI